MTATTKPVDLLRVVRSLVTMNAALLPKAANCQDAEAAYAAIAELIAKAKKAEKYLRELADAGFGDYELANELRDRIAAIQGENVGGGGG